MSCISFWCERSSPVVIFPPLLVPQYPSYFNPGKTLDWRTVSLVPCLLALRYHRCLITVTPRSKEASRGSVRSSFAWGKNSIEIFQPKKKIMSAFVADCTLVLLQPMAENHMSPRQYGFVFWCFWLSHYVNQGRIHKAVFDGALFYRCFPCPRCSKSKLIVVSIHGTSQRCVVRHAVLGVNLLSTCVIFSRIDDIRYSLAVIDLIDYDV